VSSATVKYPAHANNERALKLLTLFSILLIGYLVCGQQPLDQVVRAVMDPFRPMREADARLLLTGIDIGPATRTAVINGRVVAPGDTLTLTLGTHPTPLRVVRIERNGVTVMLHGEAQPRFLARK
jgi:hypothetical protein